jgi:hypothetical protein
MVLPVSQLSNRELDGIWKEAVVVKLGQCPGIFEKRLRKTTNELSLRIAQIPALT